MHFFDHTFGAPPENLAADEALLNQCEETDTGEILRFWEPRQYFVVLGSTNSVATEVDEEACRVLNVSLFRRASGGGTVLQGPGSICYALILRIGSTSELAGIAESNRYIMNRQRLALQPLVEHQIEVNGFTDLVLGGRKFSGNSQRRKQKYVLFHGTILLDFDLTMIAKTLRMPSKEPEYRNRRNHLDFLTCIGASAEEIRDAMSTAWSAHELLDTIPNNAIRDLVDQKYASKEWIYRL
jgi:lipoate-protein ligase A